MKKKSFIRLPPDEDSLRQHCLRANYLAYLVRHHSLKNYPSPLGHGWELVGGRCRPVRHTQPALPFNIPAPGQAEDSEDDETEIRRNLRLPNMVWQKAPIQIDHRAYLFYTKLQNIIVLPIGDV
eukprot:GHVT01044921.1.p1 GENE.GHVT01044921.1~~GHVT01044921.1.p1  ORF type:complete len:124 (+),score=1.44 GHVT01044921.1:165-536(+)